MPAAVRPACDDGRGMKVTAIDTCVLTVPIA